MYFLKFIRPLQLSYKLNTASMCQNCQWPRFYANYSSQNTRPNPQKYNNKNRTLDLQINDSDSVLANMARSIPSMCLYSRNIVKNNVDTILAYGFKPNEVLEMFVTVPQLLESETEQLTNILQSFTHIKIEQKWLNLRVKSQPELLLLDPKNFKKRCSQLTRCFPNKDLHELFMHCPAAFFEDWDSLMEKMNYILFKMGYDQKDVAYSNALNYDLEFIKLRYHMVLRTGKYKRANPKTKYLSTNIRLKELLQFTDEKICKYTQLSLEEYDCLANLLEISKDEIEEDYDGYQEANVADFD